MVYNSTRKDENGVSRLQTLSSLRNEESSAQTANDLSRSPSPSLDAAALHIPKNRGGSPAPKQPEGLDLHEDDGYLLEKAFESQSPASIHKEPKTLDDQLAARISSILTHIPANIRFKTNPEAEAQEFRAKGPHSQPSRTSSAQLFARATNAGTPALTLAPAADKSTKPRGSQEQSEIKLYHLHQPDREQPIKLYVRLVGESGERVMVRVGGGWADLGEYLKEYALHHGRRSVSDGRFGFIGAPEAEQSAALKARAEIAARTDAEESGRATPDIPVTPLASRKHLVASGTAGGAGAATRASARPHTPEPLLPSSLDGTPGSIASADDDEGGNARALGLAGPKNKEVDLSPKKRAWVNGMLSQARQASAEKKRTGLADMGKVGSTRRFFRGKKEEG